MRAAKNGHQLTVEFLVSKGPCLNHCVDYITPRVAFIT